MYIYVFIYINILNINVNLILEAFGNQPTKLANNDEHIMTIERLIRDSILIESVIRNMERCD